MSPGLTALLCPPLFKKNDNKKLVFYYIASSFLGNLLYFYLFRSKIRAFSFFYLGSQGEGDKVGVLTAR